MITVAFAAKGLMLVGVTGNFNPYFDIVVLVLYENRQLWCYTRKGHFGVM